MHGSARAQYFQVHKDVIYDQEFDTSQDSLEMIVIRLQAECKNFKQEGKFTLC